MATKHDIPLDYILQKDYEIDETKEYTLQDLHLGMRVHTGQLDSIKYTYVLLANPVLIELDQYTCEFAGTVVFIGDNQNKDLLDAWNKYTVDGKRPCKVYNTEDFEQDGFICPPDTTEEI